MIRRDGGARRATCVDLFVKREKIFAQFVFFAFGDLCRSRSLDPGTDARFDGICALTRCSHA